MYIVHISDTHYHHQHLKLESGDLLCHTGDFSMYGYKHEVESFISWLEKQAKLFTYGVVLIAGNHDRSFDPKYVKEYEPRYDIFGVDNVKPGWVNDIIKSLPDRGIIYLENELVNIGGLNIWGSPITPWFYGDRWAFNAHRHEIGQKFWNSIPNSVDILMTHGPAKFKQDWVQRTMEYVGCDSLYDNILRIKPKLHLFGHVHESFGWCYDQDTVYVNSSWMNLTHSGFQGYHMIDTSQSMITPIKVQK